MKMYRTDLTADEIKVFQRWARSHYKVFSPIDGTYHPVVQTECVKMNIEVGTGGGMSMDDCLAAGGNTTGEG